MNTQFNNDNEPNAELAAALASMTRGDGAVGIWQEALAAARPVRKRRVLGPAVQAAAALLVLAVVIGIILPSMGHARSSARMRVSVDAPAPSAAPTREAAAYFGRPMEKPLERMDELRSYGYAPSDGESKDLEPSLQSVGQERAKSAAGSALSADRQVIRKATIDLKARDVRATFLKATQLLSEANGEYIEQSSLTGQDATLQGSLTLRVSAARLSEVLNQLRGLAAVVSETSGGEDVTNQVVDLEARLHNEQRVEAELLGLMEARKDAPLKEVLELRDSISRVRENIERMTAQRERLGRLVSLATILVIINSDTTRPPPVPDGLGGYFLKQVRGAWQTSLELLTDSVAFLIRLFVGGAVFWVVGIVLFLGVLSIRRRVLRTAATEPAPRLG
jgi:hypothetical protein